MNTRPCGGGERGGAQEPLLSLLLVFGKKVKVSRFTRFGAYVHSRPSCSGLIGTVYSSSCTLFCPGAAQPSPPPPLPVHLPHHHSHPYHRRSSHSHRSHPLPMRRAPPSPCPSHPHCCSRPCCAVHCRQPRQPPSLPQPTSLPQPPSPASHMLGGYLKIPFWVPDCADYNLTI